MPIPLSLIHDLRRLPADRPVALLMRHSARYEILNPDHWEEANQTPLTEEGVQMARQFGALLGHQRKPGRLIATPVLRCRHTAEAIALGAGWKLRPTISETISFPTIDPDWRRLEDGLVTTFDPLPAAVLGVLALALDHAATRPVIDVLVSHDTVLGALLGYALRAPFAREHWPQFLEGIYFWKEGEQVAALWRGTRTLLTVPSLTPAV